MVLCAGNKCGRLFCLEFHYSKLCLSHKDWRAFTFTPWLPYKWYFQLIYVIYRWIMSIYLLVWLIRLGLASTEHFYIYLTNWSFLALNLYMVWSALVTTIEFFKIYLCCKKNHELTNIRESSDFEIAPPRGCCGAESNSIRWYHMIQWLLFTVGLDAAIAVTLLYWALLFAFNMNLGALNLNIHLVNGIVAILDIWIVGLPVNILHFIYIQAYGAAYVVFSGIYYGANGTNPFNEERYIYPQLDYGTIPGTASAAGLCSALLLLPIIHMFMYAQYIIRYWLVYRIYGYQRTKKPRVEADLQPSKEDIVLEMSGDTDK